jgi:hypothetical protein
VLFWKLIRPVPSNVPAKVPPASKAISEAAPLLTLTVPVLALLKTE